MNSGAVRNKAANVSRRAGRLAAVDRRRCPALLGGEPAFREPVYITRPRLPDQAALNDLLGGVFEAQWLTNDGALVRRLEEGLRGCLGVGFCAAICNGTTALQIALRALDATGEVITTPFTFPATAHAIQWLGLTPVFCDIDPHTYNLDVEQATSLLSRETTALLPVHTFGNPCDVVAIERFAERHGLGVIYDAAHAFGVSHRGRPIGCWGDLAIFSFHATKLFHSAEGGAITGSDPALLERIALLRNFGIKGEEEVRGVGINGKLSELHAAMGLGLLDGVGDEIRSRGALLERYAERLSQIDGIELQRVVADTVPNNAYCAVEVDAQRFGLSRDQLHRALRAENIIGRKYFFPLCSDNEAYRHLPSARPERLPSARRLASRILCLPLYGGLAPGDVDRIGDAIVAIRAAAPAIRRSAGAGSS